MATCLYPLLYDRDWLQQRVDAHATNAEIAAEIGCSKGSVGKAIFRLGLTGRRHRTRPELHTRPLSDREWLVARRAEGLTRTEIATAAGVTVASVANWIGRHGLADRNEVPLCRDRDWMLAQVDTGQSASTIADRAGSTPPTIRRWIDIHGLRSRWKKARALPVRAELADRDWLLARLDSGASRSAIARDLNVTAARVFRAVEVHGLEHLVEATVGEKSDALRRYFAGESVTAIAKSTARKGATIQRWIRDQGIEPASQRYSDAEKRSVIELLRQGEPASSIAAQRGIDPTTVRLWRRQADAARADGEAWP